mgnify:FL=1
MCAQRDRLGFSDPDVFTIYKHWLMGQLLLTEAPHQTIILYRALRVISKIGANENHA